MQGQKKQTNMRGKAVYEMQQKVEITWQNMHTEEDINRDMVTIKLLHFKA